MTALAGSSAPSESALAAVGRHRCVPKPFQRATDGRRPSWPC